jgi:hypothetical protein
MLKLTKKQVFTVQTQLLSGKPWRKKVKTCIGLIKGFYRDINEENLEWFLEVYIPSEIQKYRKEEIDKWKNDTPDKANKNGIKFAVVENPTIEQKYHVSWANKGSVFVLKSIYGEYGYLDNPKHHRKVLLKVKLSELRELK